MEEYIGYGLVIFVLATVIFLFKKLFKRNNDSLGNEDEIILDSDMVHYGPFSEEKYKQDTADQEMQIHLDGVYAHFDPHQA